MSEQNDKDKPQSRVKRSNKTIRTIAIVIAIVFVVALYFYVQNIPFTSVFHSVDKPNQNSGPVAALRDDQQGQESSQTTKSLPAKNEEGLLSKHTTNTVGSFEPNKELQAEESVSSTSVKKSERTLIKQSSLRNPKLLIDEINAFYAHLDQQSYMQSFGLKVSSKIYFSKLLQKLVDHSPVVFRETDDLFTLLQNTAHFFRILGKDNINILKAILDNERNSLEKVLSAFYELTYQPEYLTKEYSLSIPPHALTDYAGFFLNTMGGRLYLFRRDSTSRMVVSYYAIMTIDRANKDGNARQGIDLRPAIRSLIEEIEAGGSRLQLKEEYLDSLYDLQEKYG